MWILVALLVLAAAPLAHAAGEPTVRGTTAQNRPIALDVFHDGFVHFVHVSWVARCGGTTLRVRTIAGVPERGRTADTLGLTDRSVVRRGGRRLRVTLVLRGRRDRIGGTWTGTVRATAVARGSRRCVLRTTRWRAELPRVAPGAEERRAQVGAWAFQVAGDPGEFVTDGRAWSHAAPADRLSVTASGSAVHAGVVTPTDATWSLDLALPPGQRLTPGTRYVVADGGPRIDFGGMGRSCNEATGEFTVHELAYDPHALLTRLKVSFVQTCARRTASARGTLEVSAP